LVLASVPWQNLAKNSAKPVSDDDVRPRADKVLIMRLKRKRRFYGLYFVCDYYPHIGEKWVKRATALS
jgi:hypothetical protein